MAIVVSHIAGAFGALARQALRQEGLADLVELRLDRIGHPGEERLRAFLREAKKPVIVACPGPESGGEFAGSLDERLALLHAAAEAGARFVDVDWRLSLELGEVAGKCHRIVSRHEDETPREPGALEALHEEVREVLYEGDVTKIVTRAATCADGLRLLRWLRGTRGVVAFCSGAAGSFTRVLAPVLGSPFTYGAAAEMPGEPAPEPTAEGQVRANELRALLPPGGGNQETAILAVVGRPVAGSLSPRVHGMTLKAARLNAVYVALEPASLAELLELADDERFRGFSVTAPFKEEAFRLARTRDGASEAARAANTLVRERDGWRAANTDVPAVRETLERAFHLHSREPGRPVSPAVAHVLVLGAGGAARAAAHAVRSVGGRVTVAGRTPERARALAAELGCEAVAWDAVPRVEYDALVHATPVGGPAAPGALPIPEDWIRPGTLVLDAVYRPVRTPLLLAARRRGCTAVPGAEWFVRQALHQQRLFTGAEPDEALLRKAFEHAAEPAREAP